MIFDDLGVAAAPQVITLRSTDDAQYAAKTGYRFLCDRNATRVDLSNGLSQTGCVDAHTNCSCEVSCLNNDTLY